MIVCLKKPSQFNMAFSCHKILADSSFANVYSGYEWFSVKE